MAKTKSKGTTKLGRDSISKRLGVKLFAGQIAKPGNVLVRQRGTKFLPGKNVKKGQDDTLYAAKEGKVVFRITRKTCFNGKKRIAKVVDVI
jgi:large subunit ribosomal protein L27